MKLITLNTHSLIEEHYEEKLHAFAEVIRKEKPDILAMQEVNQLACEEIWPDEKLPAEGVLRDYLFKDSRKGRVFPVSRPRKGVKEAVLEYRISASAPDGSTSLADITLHTGRTHQIRVQFASRRHPLWGDGKYGSRIKGDIALQSARLRFIHPDTGKVMDFRLPVPGTWPAWGIRQENDNGTTV